MSNHTPAPWSFNGEETVYIRDYADFISIADCFSRKLPPYERTANARLIAAAPDLLEACTAIVSWCDKNPPSGDALYCIHQARSAIAKALGEDA